MNKIYRVLLAKVVNYASIMDKMFARVELNYASINRLSATVCTIVRKMITLMKKIVSYTSPTQLVLRI